MAKKVLCIAVLMLALVCVLASCGHEHEFGEWETTQEATCIAKGVETRTCECGESETKPLAAKGHSDGKWITDKEANCTEDGSKHQICSVCEATIKTEAITKLGHTDGEWITDKEANCTEDGSKHQICSVCKATIKNEGIAAIGHSWGDWIIDTNATCTESGSKHRVCSNCSDSQSEEITRLGHQKTTFISAEKIEEKFYATYTCARCENNFSEEYEPIYATFSTSLEYGSYAKYGFYVTAAGGIGDYEYQYIIYNRNSGQTLGSLKTDSNGITYTDRYGHDLFANNLVVRVYITDTVGTIAYEVVLNDGSIGSFKESVIYHSYKLN